MSMSRLAELARTLREEAHPVRRLMAMGLKRTGLGQLLTFAVRDYRLRFYPSAVSAALWFKRDDRKADYEVITRYLRPGDAYIDVGANIGSTVIPAARRIGPLGTALAFEPHPRICGYLKGNIALNRLTNVKVHCSAVGSEPGVARLTDSRCDDCNEVAATGMLEIPVVTLDNIASALAQIALLKVDVEGYEMHVFAGGKQTLARTACVYFELSSDSYCRRLGYATTELLSMLANSGFSLFRLLSGRLVRVELAYSPMESSRENVIAVRDLADFRHRTGWSQLPPEPRDTSTS